MKTIVYDLEGTKEKEIEIPKVFETPLDSKLIRRAVLSIEAASIQPTGTCKRAGKNNTAVYNGRRSLPAMMRGINVEHARLPRKKNRRGILQGNVAKVPQAVGGTRAHPLKVEKNREEKINKKEKKKATDSAIACTANKELVKKRGHLFGEVSFPVVVIDSFEKIEKTKDVVKVLEKLNLFTDVKKAKDKRKIRAGKGRKRGRKYKRKKSILIVTGTKASLYKSARNLEGVDIVTVRNLNASLLAPGAEPGRLTIWTESAIKGVVKE